MSLWRLALSVSIKLTITLGVFIGGLVAKEPLGEVLFVTLFVAFITGLVHLFAAVLVDLTAKR